jgi:hypothetical protein
MGGNRGKHFYSIGKKSIVILNSSDGSSSSQLKPDRVFDPQPDSPECVICMDMNKEMIIVPCGHYCMCRKCTQSLTKRECPICRGVIASFITKAEMDSDD